MIELFLSRKKYTDVQTIGTMDVYNDNEFVVSLATLEQEDNNNEIGNSCIPKGTYNIDHYQSAKYPKAFILKDTLPRTGILIHNGNYHTHTTGCILIGFTHADINNDGFADVLYSRFALKRLANICRGETEITIKIT